MKTVVGAFDTFAEARTAVDSLEQAGFNEHDVSIVANDLNTLVPAGTMIDQEHHSVGGETMKGAMVGGLTGLVVGLVPFVIPGLGAIAAAGWLTMTLTGVAIGAGVGLVGALMGVGIPEEEAHHYTETVRRGGTLVLIRADDARAESAARILSDAGAIDIDERGVTYRNEGFVPGTTGPVENLPLSNRTVATDSMGYVNRDPQGSLEKTEDFIMGNPIDDKTGQPVKADTRSAGEKMADALTGDRIDDKTGQVVR